VLNIYVYIYIIYPLFILCGIVILCELDPTCVCWGFCLWPVLYLFVRYFL